tara:strand:- start:1142 stop:1384 length:243 start_codon:yes stop_codon:yes gene_type:complete
MEELNKTKSLADRLEVYLEEEFNMLDSGIVATPTEAYLESFSKANQGSNDFLLMQLAKNFGYKLALLNIQDEIEDIKTGK